MSRKANDWFSECRFSVKRNLLLLVCSSLLFSCTATSFLNEGERFYDGASIKFDSHGRVKNKKEVRKKLETLIQPEPNTKVLGMRPSVWIYYVAGDPQKKKGLGNWIQRRLGQEPVLMKDVDPNRTASLLQGTMFNDGYFESQVGASVNEKNKKGSVTYAVDIYPPFTVNEIEYPKDSLFTSLLDDIKKESLIKEGKQFSLQQMKSELARLEAVLENHGYYYFDDRYLLFEADSTIGNRQVDLMLTLLPGTPNKVREKYVLNEINVINDYYFKPDSLTEHRDSLMVDGYNYSSTKGTFRPEIITNVINLRQGSIYRRDDHNFTINHLMGLGAFKFVNIKYSEAADSSRRLDAQIFLTPLLKKSIRLEAVGTTKTNNFVGPGAGVTFTNRNFLRGAERFELKVNGSYEWQISNKQASPINAIEFTTEASLSVPRMLLPIKIRSYSGKYLPQTKFIAGIDFQRRVNYFQMNSFNMSYGYIWRETTAKSHELFPMEINYVNVGQTTAGFNNLLENNLALRNSFQSQFIPAMRYSFTLNTQLKEQDTPLYGEREVTTSNFYFRGNLSLAGNLLHSLVRGSTSSDEEKPYNFLGQPYSQFVLGDVDFRYYWQMDRHNKLVARLAFGAGYAYGNSGTLPYIKQFASGGSSSVRAFPARSIGPGTYNVFDDPDFDNNYFVDQRGDVKVEGNIEYRYDIYRTVKGAVFVDAGNNWLWKEDDQRPGAKFDSDTFFSELAIGTGLGIRLDFNFFILRFDLAFPIRKPYLPEGERWVFDEIDLGSKTWRRDNLVFNIAIGYPF